MVQEKRKWIEKLLYALGALALVIIPLVWNNVKELLFPSHYLWNPTFVNGKVVLCKVQVIYKEVKKERASQIVDTTNWQGQIIAHLSNGDYRGTVNYKGQSYPFIVSIAGQNTDKSVDISGALFVPNPDTAHKKLSQDVVDTLINVAQLNNQSFKRRLTGKLAVIENSESFMMKGNQKPSVKRVQSENMEGKAAPVKQESAPKTETEIFTKKSIDNILGMLTIRVRKDVNDKNRSGQIAYHYYIGGSKADLDEIKAVYYKRNHYTFPEYSGDKYQTSNDRNTNFDFSGYQWGFISDTFLAVQLKDGSISNYQLKQLNYDN